MTLTCILKLSICVQFEHFQPWQTTMHTAASLITYCLHYLVYMCTVWPNLCKLYNFTTVNINVKYTWTVEISWRLKQLLQHFLFTNLVLGELHTGEHVYEADTAEDQSPTVDIMHLKPDKETVMDAIINRPQIIICWCLKYCMYLVIG